MKAVLDRPGWLFLNAPEREFLNSLIERLSALYPLIQKLYLYGSKARGDFLEDSDLD
jgi:predicted nucleotidyltransferase